MNKTFTLRSLWLWLMLMVVGGVNAQVAQIGSEMYGDLGDAITAAQDGELITLLQDIEDNIVVPAGKNITIDLGGKTLNGKQTAGKATLLNKGTLVLKNGNVRRSATGSASYYVIENEGTITMTDGLDVEGSANSSLIRNNAATAKMTVEAGNYTQTGAFIVLKNDLGELVVNGGTFTTTADKNVLNNWDQMTINGGTFNGNILNGAYDTDNNKLTINGGTFSAEKIRTYLGNGKTTCPIDIKGGEFTNENLKFVGTSGSESDANIQVNVVSGTFAVEVPSTYTSGAAKIGDNYYATLVDAIKAVNTGVETSPATIKMLADDDMLATIAVVAGKEITLDLNGKTVKNDASKTLGQLITVNGKLTIDDNSAEKNGVIKNTANKTYVINTGSATSTAVLTLNNGTIQTTTGSSNGAVYGSGGSFVMTGGKVIAAGSAVYCKNVNISGGEITAVNQAVSAGGTISGGTITSTGKYPVYASNGATLEITGGTFSSAAGQPTVKVYTADVKVADGVTLPNGIDFASNATAMVLPGTPDAYLTATHAAIYDGETLVGYAPINTGILKNSKVSDKVVKLTKDVATTTNIAVGKSFTLDLNGHNIICTPTKDDAVLVLAGTSASARAELTIKGEGKIAINENSTYGCNAVQGGRFATLNIEGGEYFVPGDNATIYIANTSATSPTVVNISGGKFSSGDGKYVLNVKDNQRAGAQFNVSGGTFVNFDPQNNVAEGTNTSFVTDGYMSVDNGDGTFGAAIVEVTMGYQSCSDKYNGGTPVKFDVNSGFDIVDDGNVQSVSIPADIDGAAVTYKRNLKTAYQSWYVPFDYTLTAEDVEKVRFLDIFNLDVDEQTGKAKNIVGRVMIAGETVKANKPYMVKAVADAGEYTFEATGLKKTEEKAIWCESTSLRYTFGGIYNAVSLSAPNPFWALSSNGVFEYWDEAGVVQNAFGFVMVIQDKDNGLAAVNPHGSTQSARRINLRIIGDDDEEVTGISSVQSAETVAGGKIYDIAGRQLNSMSKAGLYIVNGKKIYRK